VYIDDWEAAFAPCDEDTYSAVIAQIAPYDVVLDIGAGDLRLTRRMAAVAWRVYAIERDPAVLAKSDRRSWPTNLIVICADALQTAFPADVTTAVLLMRHCTREHFATYVKRLSALPYCRQLITNARWKMNVEAIELRSGLAYDPDRTGWYACRCGSVDFTAGDPGIITPQLLAEVVDVVSCPHCET
jgi:SAM-dependent methyltransferase